MMLNERGGILSKLFIIPLGVALMMGFFFLGYYVGIYQSRSGTQNEVMPPLPDIISKNLPTKEEFTFYKTLTDKNEKTVSIDLKPQSSESTSMQEVKQDRKPGKKAEKKQTGAGTAKDSAAQPKVKDKQQEPAVPKQTQPQIAKTTPSAPVATKVRYTLQLASYQDKTAAENDVKKMKQRGYAAFIVSADVPGKGLWHRVRLGSFANKVAAEKLQKELNSKEGLSPIIIME